MKLFLSKYKVKEAFFVDDLKENLKTASQHGISTIWLTDEEDSPQFIDRKITKLIDLIKS